MKRFFIGFIMLNALLLTGCASIVKGSNQLMTIDSNVKGADIYVNGAVIGQTPYTGNVKRGHTTIVMLKKDGYDAKTMTLSSEVEPFFWGNILLGGLLGSSTDYGTGAMYKYAPATLNVDLVKTAGNQ